MPFTSHVIAVAISLSILLVTLAHRRTLLRFEGSGLLMGGYICIVFALGMGTTKAFLPESTVEIASQLSYAAASLCLAAWSFTVFRGPRRDDT